MKEGFLFGLGLAFAFMCVRFPFAIVMYALDTWRGRVDERQGDNRLKLAALKRKIRLLENTLGRDPESKQ